MKISAIMFALLRFEINGTKLCDDVKNLITPEILPVLFALSKNHDLAHLIADALEKNGLLEEGSKARQFFLQERNMAISRYEQQQYELNRICKVLEDEKIAYIPLKGSVIRKLYPEPWMRTSCDIDILVKENDLNRAIYALKQQLNYTAKDKKEYHDISLFSPSGVHLELHFILIDDNKRFDNLLKKPWEYAVQINEDSFKYQFSNEYFLAYIISHVAYHFVVGGGCGVRSLVDISILNKIQHNKEKVVELCEKCGLTTFYNKISELSSSCMDGEFSQIEQEDLLEFILNAGMYGDFENRAAINQTKKGGKGRYFLSRIFIPYGQLKRQFSVLEKHKWLMPFCQIARWFKLLFGKNSKNFKKELKANIKVQGEKQESVAKLLKELDL